MEQGPHYRQNMLYMYCYDICILALLNPGQNQVGQAKPKLLAGTNKPFNNLIQSLKARPIRSIYERELDHLQNNWLAKLIKILLGLIVHETMLPQR